MDDSETRRCTLYSQQVQHMKWDQWAKVQWDKKGWCDSYAARAVTPVQEALGQKYLKAPANST